MAPERHSRRSRQVRNPSSGRRHQGYISVEDSSSTSFPNDFNAAGITALQHSPDFTYATTAHVSSRNQRIGQQSLYASIEHVSRPWTPNVAHHYSQVSHTNESMLYQNGSSNHQQPQLSMSGAQPQRTSTSKTNTTVDNQHVYNLQGIGAWTQGTSSLNTSPLDTSALSHNLQGTGTWAYPAVPTETTTTMQRWEQEQTVSQPWHAIEGVYAYTSHQGYTGVYQYEEGEEGDDLEEDLQDMYSMTCNASTAYDV